MIDLDNGMVVGTGLKMPDFRPERLARFPSAKRLSMETIAEMLRNPRRTPRRERFGPDWIRNQGGRGSCNGYAGAKALERVRVMRGLPWVPLSGEFLYASINGGRDVGSMLDEGMEALATKGVAPEDMVQHEEYRWNRISGEAKAAAANFVGFEPYRVDDEIDLGSGLAQGYVGVVAVHVTSRFSRLDGDGVVASTDGQGNHAVGVDDVRIKGNELQFDMFNSWGTNYGDRGRGWLSWNRHFRTTSKYHAFYLIRSTRDNKQGTNPPEIRS